MRVVITFKESEKWIYDEIQKHSQKGGWVKDVIAEYIRNTKEKEKVPKDDFSIFD